MPLPTPARILLIDDHRLFNDGLKLLIDEQPDLMVCGQVFRSADVPAIINTQQPNLILMDVNLQGVNGIDLGKKIIADFPAVKIIILTMYNQAKLLDEARKAGLHGYLLKETTTPDLLAGIRAVLLGETVFDANVITLMPPPDDAFGDDFARKLNLTFREVEIIRLIKEGLTNEQIGEALSISVFTVKTHRKNIHFKLDISNVAELIQFATKHGL